MKLKVKSNHLDTKNKYRYKVYFSEEDFYKLDENIDFFDIEKKEGLISFQCSSKTIKILDKLELDYKKEDKIKNYLLKNKIKICISLIFIIFIMTIFVLNQIFIRNIKFNKNNYNQDVYEYVEDKLNKVGPFYMLKGTINEISNNLRKEFYQYAFIGLSKRGADLIIDIVEQGIPKEEEIIEPLIGEYYSKHDATIMEVNLVSGQLLTSYNDVVKKGDLLATSNLQYKENLYSKDKMVPLVGSIIGKTISYVEITVLKEEEIEIFTNKCIKFYTLKFKNREIFKKKNPFVISYLDEDIVFNIPFISINKHTVYEKEISLIKRTYDEAYELSTILLKQEFEKNRTCESEKIVSIKIINFTENNSKYTFRYLVCAYQNIVESRKFIEVSN